MGAVSEVASTNTIVLQCNDHNHRVHEIDTQPHLLYTQRRITETPVLSSSSRWPQLVTSCHLSVHKQRAPPSDMDCRIWYAVYFTDDDVTRKTSPAPMGLVARDGETTPPPVTSAMDTDDVSSTAIVTKLGKLVHQTRGGSSVTSPRRTDDRGYPERKRRASNDSVDVSGNNHKVN